MTITGLPYGGAIMTAFWFDITAKKMKRVLHFFIRAAVKVLVPLDDPEEEPRGFADYAGCRYSLFEGI